MMEQYGTVPIWFNQTIKPRQLEYLERRQEMDTQKAINMAGSWDCRAIFRELHLSSDQSMSWACGNHWKSIVIARIHSNSNVPLGRLSQMCACKSWASPFGTLVSKVLLLWSSTVDFSMRRFRRFLLAVGGRMIARRSHEDTMDMQLWSSILIYRGDIIWYPNLWRWTHVLTC